MKIEIRADGAVHIEGYVNAVDMNSSVRFLLHAVSSSSRSLPVHLIAPAVLASLY